MAIAAGLAIFIVMNAMMVGFTEEIIDLTVESSPSVVVLPKPDEEYIHLYHGLERYVLGIEGVSEASPVLLQQAVATYKHNSRGVSVKGIDPPRAVGVLPYEEKMREGTIYAISSEHSVILGDALAQHLEVDVGRDITLLVPSGARAQLKVVGIVDTGTPEDEVLVLMSLGGAQRLFHTGDVITSLELRTYDIHAAQGVAERIRHDTGYAAKSWIEMSADIFRTIEMEGTFMALFSVFIMVIVALGIANSLLMMVFEKTRDVGMLKAMGATGGHIRNIFLLESVLLALFGMAIGTPIGVLLSHAVSLYHITVPSDIYMVSTLPVALRLRDVVLIDLFVLAITVVAGVYPATRAGRLDPVEALRYE
ncbi:MAG TPA: ABC transporter permease [Methermicoccus shengliensis]|uniref:ABC transporter permease n=1 Tax=Methermicoccus shengliensis TaxID=660064 RepID=A0A832RTR9_9EURY|nr:MAG: Uncharacterized protein XD46_0775 [Euryarchaeota archaeon 55_53]KUK30084.1 MAG: Uncharacterized protein XD62_0806 [Methanosarcinales archeaon 56_1174]MDI3487500.1 lipoprotein-releasing system permease protein [Methanosarcinales archaeon]MDN5295173.1 lipoprotein-releasing system permease protein [Methanosarcinales archaeon]HIH69157.1 ABC transporter permease [Methermicoccus shengliensis]